MREQEIRNTGYFVRDDGAVRLKRGKISRGCMTRPGYKQVTMYHNGHMLSRYVHILVAEAFVKNPRPDLFDMVDHIDHNKKNNHFSNLRWVDSELNKSHQKGECVVRRTNNKFRPWCSRPYKMRQLSFATRAEAVECSRLRKKERFEKLYREKVSSEPRFKSVGVQTTPISCSVCLERARI